MQRKQRRRKSRRSSSLLRVIIIALAVVLLTAIITGVIYLRAWMAIRGTENTYLPGIYVNGISLGGYTREAGNSLFTDLIDQWKSGKYDLTYEDNTWTFTPGDIGADLQIEGQLSNAWSYGHSGSVFARRSVLEELQENPVYLYGDVVCDQELLNALVSGIASQIDTDPIDAEIVCDIDKPRVVTQSVDGLTLNQDAAKEAIQNMVKTGVTSYALEVTVTAPAVSSQDANGGLMIIAQCTTSTTTSSSKRLSNVKRALDFFNALTVHDGERISFNSVVGKRTKARGFVEAPEYATGEVVEGIGGGVCQASTTLYGALLVSGVDIIERHPHSMTVGYTEPSFDAAVTDTNKNLIFENNTGAPIYIYTEVTKEHAMVTIYGVKPKYRIKLESVILQDNIEPKSTRYEEDESGKFAYYTDEVALKSEGKMGLKSECWRISYDWETGEEVSRKKMSTDSYSPGVTVYYIGTHERE